MACCSIATLAGTSGAMTAALRWMNAIGVGAPTALRSAATTASGCVLRLRSTALADCLQERCKKRIGRPPLPDDELVSKIKAVVAELPTYGYRRIHAVLKRQ